VCRWRVVEEYGSRARRPIRRGVVCICIHRAEAGLSRGGKGLYCTDAAAQCSLSLSLSLSLPPVPPNREGLGCREAHQSVGAENRRPLYLSLIFIWTGYSSTCY
jgi:hypothetical protein